MDSKPVFAILDFGTSSGRCMLVDPGGRVLGHESINWNANLQASSGGIQYSFSAETAWESMSACCRAVLSKTGVQPSAVAGVITTSQRHGSVVLDRQGTEMLAFTNAVELVSHAWLDAVRSDPEVIYQITGRWPQTIFLPAHLLWLKQENEAQFDRIGTILGIQDWLLYRLSGQLCSEPTIAADLLLYDIQGGSWSPELLSRFGFPPAWFPPVLPAGTQVGEITQIAARQTGFIAGTPVINGGADSQMAVAGLGVLKKHQLAVVFGSSIPLMTLTDSPLFHGQAALWTNPHLFSDQWILESNAGDGGLCINQFRDGFVKRPYSEELPATDQEPPSLNELDRLAAALQRESGNLVASVGPMIFHGRDWPQINGMIHGFNLLNNGNLNLTHLYRALIHNIAYAIFANAIQLEATTGADTSGIRIGGPALESPLWPQLLADIFGRPIQIPREKEATSIGAAIVAASSLGVYPDLPSAAQNMVHLDSVEPDPEALDWYRRNFCSWQELYKRSLQPQHG